MGSEIRKTLRDIFTYIGIDIKYADDATVRTYIERLLDKHAKEVFPTRKNVERYNK